MKPAHSQRHFSSEVTTRHRSQVSIDRKAHVDERNEGRQNITNMNCLRVETLWDVERRSWHHLLPAEAHVRAEDGHCADIKDHPTEGLEDPELKTVDVTHVDRFATLVAYPEQ